MRRPARAALAQYSLFFNKYIQFAAGSARQQVESLAITTRSLDYKSSAHYLKGFYVLSGSEPPIGVRPASLESLDRLQKFMPKSMANCLRPSSVSL